MEPARRAAELLAWMAQAADPRRVEALARTGARPKKPLGVPREDLRAQAKAIGHDQKLALVLWTTGVHEARMLAAMIADPGQLDGGMMDRWIREVDSWDLGDLLCSELFRHTRWAWAKALEWTTWDLPLVKRAAFVLMAQLAAHETNASDDQFKPFLRTLERGTVEHDRLVWKAVSAAIKQIGMRSPALRQAAIAAAEGLAQRKTIHGRGVAGEALRGLKEPVDG